MLEVLASAALRYARAMELRDKVVWITGASSGIGEALAHASAKRGAKLILSARRTDALERVRTACGRDNSTAMVLPLDVSDLASLPGKADEVIKRFGRIDILVHNAGVSQRARAIDTSIQVDEAIMRTNFLGPVALTKAVLPTMTRAKSGHIVVVSSLVGKFGTPMRTSYAASKHALHGFFDSLRAEVFADGIQVNIVCPGFVRTEVSRHALTGDGSQHGQMDEATARGIAPEAASEAILKAVAAGREETYVGGREVAGVYLKRFAPTLLSRIIRRAKVT